MANYIHYCMWYTVWDAKTGEAVTAGTAEMCARKLGYSSANSFASAVNHLLTGKRVGRKYNFYREYIDRREVDSLPSIQRHPRRKDRCERGAKDMNRDKNCTTCRWRDSFSWDCLNYTTDHEESCEYWEERNENESEAEK